MESNKFDNTIKETLEGRKLQPSNDAWAKLSERLDHEEKNHTKKTIWWLGIAASLVGVFFMAFQFFNTEEVKPIIVDAPTVNEKNNNIQVVLDDVKTEKAAIKDIEENEAFEKLPLKEKISFPNIKNSIAITKENTIIKTEVIIQTVKKEEENLRFEEQKIQDVVAQVEALKSQNLEVTDAVIDQLLLQAQKEIRLKKMYNSTTGIVDANMLLQEVEADLDQSFRSKVFDAIKASYNSVKTAVAQRNE
ncbi:hypothetical protein EV196_105115 [Mariniflexile fucanivorans]|uniref:Uncharacterized protein n=1 Tax=Mariniflexile fucanivorans TaxID=264023 RepID=A0A4V6NGV8_9FLAO|nr:hypothetical protein [Mariniflexile fucanivorans]TCL65457.1 hypothetical protein EV196_105115 [Mariniflexile fucanivorans]